MCNRSIPKTAGFELMVESVRKIRSVRITSALREYFSGRCEQSIDTQDSGVRAHGGKCPGIWCVRFTSRLREYYSGRCEQSMDTQDSGVRAHDDSGVSESLRDCVNTTQDDVSNRSLPKTVGFELMMKFGVSESLRDCVNTTQDDVSNRSIAKTVGFELMMKSVGKIRTVRITSGLGEYYSARCEQSIDTQDSGVRAHDGKCPNQCEVSESLRDCVNTTQDDVSNRSIPKTAGFELMMSVRKNRSVRITSRLREYYSGRCEQSIDTQDSVVRAHDENVRKKCPNHFAIA